MFHQFDFKGSKVRSTITGLIERVPDLSAGLSPVSVPGHSSSGSLPVSSWFSAMSAGSDSPRDAQTSFARLRNTSVSVHDSRPDSFEDSGTLSEALLQQASLRLSVFLHEERDRYRPEGRTLNENARALYSRFFSGELLDQIRVLVLSGRRLANPSFFGEENDLVAVHFPNFAHKASMTFLDVIVFNERITERELFQALVHAAQVNVLGVQVYAEQFVRGVLQSRSYSLAPIQAQAFTLAGRFAENPDAAFSVEGEIRSAFGGSQS